MSDTSSGLFKVVALFFVAAAVFHGLHVFVPAPEDAAGALRHAVFVFINLVVAAGLWFRPAALRFVFGFLVVQQVASHGTTAWTTWSTQGSIDFVSIVIVLLLPLLWVVLWRAPR